MRDRCREVLRHGVVVVVDRGERAPPAGQSAQVHGVAGELGLGARAITIWKPSSPWSVPAMRARREWRYSEHVSLAVGRDRHLKP